MSNCEKKIEYSEKIDAVIYNECCDGFDSEDFLELALAALDQFVEPNEQKTVSVIKQVEELRHYGSN